MTTGKEVFNEGEVINFRRYRPNSAQGIGLNVEFDNNLPQSEGVFVPNGLSAFLKVGIVNDVMPLDENWISILPNPIGKVCLSK